jgi:hypothetical protein
VLPLVLIFAIVVGAMTGGFATPTEGRSARRRRHHPGGDVSIAH